MTGRTCKQQALPVSANQLLTIKFSNYESVSSYGFSSKTPRPCIPGNLTDATGILPSHILSPGQRFSRVVVCHSRHQKGRSSFSSVAAKSTGGTETGGTADSIDAGAAPITPGAATRSTFQARILLNQRSCHWRASISNDTVSSSPIWMLNCAILSAPNTSKHILRGYWSWFSMTYS